MKYKKFIPILVLLIIIVYLAIYIVRDIPKQNNEHYSNNQTINTNTNTNIPKEDDKPKESTPKEDNNPITIGLYHTDKTLGKRTLKESYRANMVYHKDIISLNVFFTNEEQISNAKPAGLYEQYAANYNNIDNYRIGYIIEYNDLKVQILRPSDTEQIYDTLEVYLYDAIAHKNDSWYSHTTDEEFNKNTLLQGIKLTAGKNINNITTDIKVTAFTYDEDDFDDNNNYIGKCSYTVTVIKA